MLQEELIASCGMNCQLCVAYQFREKDLNRQGFQRKYCPGCIPRGENCTHMRGLCDLLATGKIRFCFECDKYPCPRLKRLDKRYRQKYHMSMLANLESIRQHGIAGFLSEEDRKWRCPECGDVICCHYGLCLNCNIDTLLENKKYRWGE